MFLPRGYVIYGDNDYSAYLDSLNIQLKYKTRTEEHKDKEKDKKKDEVTPAADGALLAAELEPAEIAELEKKKVNENAIEVVCNGIRYQGIIIKQEEVPEIWCEECYRELSILRCDLCDEFFCSKCFTLCHQRMSFGQELHPHELEDAVRPVQAGDKSSRPPPPPEDFVMPDYELYEHTVTHKDLTKPNSLAINASHHIAPSTLPLQPLKFKVGDLLVYFNPDTAVEEYGRIVSDWDFQNAEAAPSIIRGDGSLAWYIVEYIGEVTKDVLLYLEQIALENQVPHVERSESHEELTMRLMTSHVNEAVYRAKKIRATGPPLHLHPVADVDQIKALIARNEIYDPASARDVREIPDVKASERTVLGVIRGDGLQEDDILAARHKFCILPEARLFRARERLLTIQKENKERRERLMDKVVCAFTQRVKSWWMDIWKRYTISVRDLISFRCAVLIQCLVRRWLCKDTLRKLWHLSLYQQYEKWKDLHSRFQYCSATTPGAITIDNKIFFRNLHQLNIYTAAMRVAVSKFMRVLKIQRINYLQDSFKQWREVIHHLNEADMKGGHFEQFELESTDDPEIILDTEARRLFAVEGVKRYNAFKNSTAVDVDLAALPIGLTRDNTNTLPPPWHASIGVVNLPKLPDLPDVVMENTKPPDKRSKNFTVQQHQKYNSFRAMIGGPTDNSCWIIPNRLVMGKMPLGRARSKGVGESIVQTRCDALSQLVLAGVDTFVSLLDPEEEEAAVAKANQEVESGISAGSTVKVIKSIEDALKYNWIQSRNALKSISQRLQYQYDTLTMQLEDYKNLDPADKHYDELHAEGIRYKAKRRLVIDSLTRANKEQDQFPQSVHWLRFPMKEFDEWSMNEILPSLWAIEQLIAEGKKLYIYSGDGVGRAGLICGCVLGRLYGLTPSETLLRMQSYHDCEKSQLNKTVSLNCPRSRSQQELLCHTIIQSNRVYDGITVISQRDPESSYGVVEHPIRGHQLLHPVIKDTFPLFETKKTAIHMKEKYSTSMSEKLIRHVPEVRQEAQIQYDPKDYRHGMTALRVLPVLRPQSVEKPMQPMVARFVESGADKKTVKGK